MIILNPDFSVLIKIVVIFRKAESIKSDFIPHVVQKQFSKVKENVEDTEISFLNKNVKNIKGWYVYNVSAFENK